MASWLVRCSIRMAPEGVLPRSQMRLINWWWLDMWVQPGQVTTHDVSVDAEAQEFSVCGGWCAYFGRGSRRLYSSLSGFKMLIILVLRCHVNIFTDAQLGIMSRLDES